MWVGTLTCGGILIKGDACTVDALTAGAKLATWTINDNRASKPMDHSCTVAFHCKVLVRVKPDGARSDMLFTYSFSTCEVMNDG